MRPGHGGGGAEEGGRARAVATAAVPVALAVALGVGSASLTRPPEPTLVRLSDPVVGSLDGAGVEIAPDADALPVRIIADYECSACEALERAAGPTLRTWAREGSIRYQLVQMPLSVHRRAPRAARALLCASDQSTAWPMHEILVRGRSEWGWGPDPRFAFLAYARDLGLDVPRFEACLDDPETLARQGRDAATAARLGGQTVPVILVGSTLVSPQRSFREILDYVTGQLKAAS